MKIKPQYPTQQHEQAAKVIVKYFAKEPSIEAVILYGSCARGKAVPGSCLDIRILLTPENLTKKKVLLEIDWKKFYRKKKIFKKLKKWGKYAHIDLDFSDGVFVQKSRDWTSGPDEFELAIGNTFVYSKPLLENSNYFRKLKSKWLPYYNEDMRKKRLAMVKKYCFNNLDHITGFAKRGLYFQAFNRLYDAFQEFLQALFISRRIYPIAYDKWIKEQIVDILRLPELYQKLPRLFEFKNFESLKIIDKAEELRKLFKQYVIKEKK